MQKTKQIKQTNNHVYTYVRAGKSLFCSANSYSFKTERKTKDFFHGMCVCVLCYCYRYCLLLLFSFLLLFVSVRFMYRYLHFWCSVLAQGANQPLHGKFVFTVIVRTFHAFVSLVLFLFFSCFVLCVFLLFPNGIEGFDVLNTNVYTLVWIAVFQIKCFTSVSIYFYRF